MAADERSGESVRCAAIFLPVLDPAARLSRQEL